MADVDVDKMADMDDANMADTDVDMVHHVIYRIVIPILTIVGVIFNTICIIVLSRPKLRSIRVNRYFRILVVSDFLVCIFHIPVSTTVTACIYSGYTEAFYFAHFGWPVICFSQSLGTYVILWLALDRFTAVWLWKRFAELQKRPNIVRNRMLFTLLVCFVMHIAYVINGEVYCSNDDSKDTNCDNGTWVIVTGYMNNYDQTWHEVYRSLYSVFVRWLPYILLIVFNIGLVIGVAHGRVKYPKGKSRKRKNELYLAMTMISITASSIFFTLPIIIYLTIFAAPREDRCTGLHPEEVLRGIGNTLQLFEHVVHVVFLTCLNHGFRNELKSLLYCKASEASPQSLGGTPDGGTSGDNSMAELKVQNLRVNPLLRSARTNRQTVSEMI